MGAGMFVDEATIYIEAGRGGNGAIAFRREKFVPAGGPAGGDGGHGGSVIFQVQSGLSTLSDFRHHRQFRARSGEPGGNSNRYGAKGEDVVISVPPGTLVYNEAGELIADLTEPGESRVVAKGGRGGKGNSHFVSSTHRAPRIAERGEPGEALWVRLELRLLADVGLVGFPNVGKSTLISRISAARPKIADYPFTTLTPNLGVVDRYGEPFVVADVPGLIEGAHAGAGLGHTFLRHLTRTRVLLHLVDVSDTTRDVQEDFRLIETELARFSQDLASRPRLVVANKMDAPGAEERLRALEAVLGSEPVYQISAISGDGVDRLMWAVREMLNAHPVVLEPVAEPVVRPEVKGFHIESEDQAVRLLGDVEDRARRTLWGNLEAETYFCEYLRRRGVPRAVEAFGLAEGTPIFVADGTVWWENGDIVPRPSEQGHDIR